MQFIIFLLMMVKKKTCGALITPPSQKENHTISVLTVYICKWRGGAVSIAMHKR
jgi:hypothetical protein